ncbi:MAG: BON domain-containing protein [Bryobacteraceae bacterium]
MHRSFTSVLCGIALSGMFLLPAVLQAQDSQNTAPDNTRVNKRDTNSTEQTADQAKNHYSDRQLMSHIRRDVVKDKSLSTDAHNIKIISDHGKVTLKGPVHSDDEKKAIEQYARKYAGDENVTDEITVNGDQK